MDIIIYTTPETLEHKKGGDGYEEYYWNLPNPPKDFKVGDKVYFATKGMIRGYFITNSFNPYDEETICWNKNSWVDIDTIPCKPFQGFKYKRR